MNMSVKHCRNGNELGGGGPKTENLIQLPLFPQQISRELVQDRSRVFAVMDKCTFLKYTVKDLFLIAQ
jgi:hypothetical protein